MGKRWKACGGQRIDKRRLVGGERRTLRLHIARGAVRMLSNNVTRLAWFVGVVERRETRTWFPAQSPHGALPPCSHAHIYTEQKRDRET